MATAVNAKVVLTGLFTLLAIIHTVSGGEYCCAYFTPYGTYRKSFYCPKYCCGTTEYRYQPKNCCAEADRRYYPSYSSRAACPTPIPPTRGSEVAWGFKVDPGEYCCAYFTSSGSYRNPFFCPNYCCGTSTRKYCCPSLKDRYNRSYHYLSSCPTTSKNRSSWSSWSGWSSNTRSSGFLTVGGTVIGIVAGLAVLWLVIGGIIWCKKKRGAVTKPPENYTVMLNTTSTTQGYPDMYAPPPNTSCRPEAPQPANVAYSSKTQATDTCTARYEDPPPPYPGTDAEYPLPTKM